MITEQIFMITEYFKWGLKTQFGNHWFSIT